MIDRIAAWIFKNVSGLWALVMSYVIQVLGVITTRILMGATTFGIGGYGLSFTEKGHPEHLPLVMASAMFAVFGTVLIQASLCDAETLAKQRLTDNGAQKKIDA